MGLPKPITVQKKTYYVYKTGLPFYDAARLIGVAHLFLGTASAEVEDKGSFWEVRGILTKRSLEQVEWVLKRLNPTKKERKLFDNLSKKLSKLEAYFTNQCRSGRQEELKAEKELKAEYDAALQIGTRGVDPLSKYEILAPRSTGETKKKFKTNYQEIAAATLGRAFAASVVSSSKRQEEEMYVLPTFREHFVLSGFLTYERSFDHPAGGWIAAVQAALSILLDLRAKRLPVVDFAFTREVKRRRPIRQPIFSNSGYLGLERLCAYWWREVVERNNPYATELLRNFRLFLQHTRRENIDEQVQALARWVADFVANPNIEALTKIEQLKARIMAASQNQQVNGIYETQQFLNSPLMLKEVPNMMDLKLPDVPRQVSEALARALSFDEKGWMNQFTRLENAGNFSQFIQQVERIISRGYYREQQESEQAQSICKALTRAQDVANKLREIENQLPDERSFRAWKAIFLLDVLSRLRFQRQAPEVETAEEQEVQQ